MHFLAWRICIYLLISNIFIIFDLSPDSIHVPYFIIFDLTPDSIHLPYATSTLLNSMTDEHGEPCVS